MSDRKPAARVAVENVRSVVSGEDVGLLADIPLLQGLTAEQRQTVIQDLHRRKVPAGALLMMADEPGEAAYLIVSGTMKIYVDRPDGTETIVGLRGPGEIIGEMSLVDRHSRSANVVTLEPCTVLRWNQQSFEACLQTMPVLSVNLLRVMARRLRLATAQIQSLAGLDLYGRVARQILAFAEEYGERTKSGATLIPLRLTQNDLAGLVGGSRVRVNEVIVAYKRRKYISVDPQHRITVHDAAALAERCR